MTTNIFFAPTNESASTVHYAIILVGGGEQYVSSSGDTLIPVTPSAPFSLSNAVIPLGSSAFPGKKGAACDLPTTDTITDYAVFIHRQIGSSPAITDPVVACTSFRGAFEGGVVALSGAN